MLQTKINRVLGYNGEEAILARVTTEPLHELPGELHGRSRIGTRAESASRGPFKSGNDQWQ